MFVRCINFNYTPLDSQYFEMLYKMPPWCYINHNTNEHHQIQKLFPTPCSSNLRASALFCSNSIPQNALHGIHGNSGYKIGFSGKCQHARSYYLHKLSFHLRFGRLFWSRYRRRRWRKCFSPGDLRVICISSPGSLIKTNVNLLKHRLQMVSTQ